MASSPTRDVPSIGAELSFGQCLRWTECEVRRAARAALPTRPRGRQRARLGSACGDLHRRERMRACSAVHGEGVKDLVAPHAGVREHDASAVDPRATRRSGP